MVNDFEEFALQFRKRTAARLLEFESALNKAQTEVEKSAEESARLRHHAAAKGGPASATPSGPPRPRASGQVKGVLRRQ